jgi:hypothetical protein
MANRLSSSWGAVPVTRIDCRTLPSSMVMGPTRIRSWLKVGKSSRSPSNSGGAEREVFHADQISFEIPRLALSPRAWERSG